MFHVFRVGGVPVAEESRGKKGDPAPPRTAVAGASLLDAEQLHLEDEGGRRGNDRRETALAVRVVRGARQLGNLPDGHSRHPLVPSLDDLADADGELEGLAAVLGAVELGAVRESTCVRGGRGDRRQRVRFGSNPAREGGRRRAAEGLASAHPPVRGFDFFAGGVAMRTGVVGGDDLPGLGEGHAITRLEGLDVYAHLRKRACVRAGGSRRSADTRNVRLKTSDLLTGVKGQLCVADLVRSSAHAAIKVLLGRNFFSIVSEERNRAGATSGRGLARVGGGRRRIDTRVAHRAHVSNRARDRALASGILAGRNPGVFEPRDG